MWGGRFTSGPGAIMEEINASIDFDRHLYRQDIAASKAHAEMLAKQGIITADDAKKIAHGLDTILSEIEAGKFSFQRALEDIHMNVEGRLAELIGAAAGRLHTARSRNDQVATDFRLWMRDTIDALDKALAAFQRALADKALAHAGIREGATENTAVVSSLLSELAERGLDFSVPRLYILDGGKALHAAVRRHAGEASCRSRGVIV